MPADQMEFVFYDIEELQPPTTPASPASPLATSPLPSSVSNGSSTHRNVRRSFISPAPDLIVASASVRAPSMAMSRSGGLSNGGGGGSSSERGGRSESRNFARQPRNQSEGPVPSTRILVADVMMVRTRLMISKTYTIYNSPEVNFRSAIVGYNVTFHSPPNSSSRVRNTELNLIFRGQQAGQDVPLIKAISPSPRSSTAVGVSTSTHHSTSTTSGVSLGYDPFGDLHIAHTTAHQWTQITSAKLVVSGIHSSHAMITLEEDPTTNEGVPTSFDFAILLELPDAPQTTEFEVDLKVEASVSRRLEESVRRMLGSPRNWIMSYDGITQMGELRVAQLTSTGEVIMRGAPPTNQGSIGGATNITSTTSSPLDTNGRNSPHTNGAGNSNGTSRNGVNFSVGANVNSDFTNGVSRFSPA